MRKDYIKINKQEFKQILIITATLAIMFSLTFVRFQTQDVSLIENFMIFFIFLGTLLCLQTLFMKAIAYKNGIELELRTTYLNRYWFKDYDTLSYSLDNKKGIPTPLASFILYILTLGVIIFPSTWNYNMKIIPYKHTGIKQKYEGGGNQGISHYRYGKILFSSFLFLTIAALFLKVFSTIFNSYFYWFLFTIFWIAFITLAPLLGTLGYDFFIRSKFGWMSSLVIMVTSLLAITMFQNTLLIIAMGIVAFIIIMLMLLWKDLV